MKCRKLVLYIKRYQNISIELKATIWFVLCSFVQKAINSITIPIFTRMMSTSEYGEFALYSSWLSILTIIVTLNFNSVLTNKGMSKYPEHKEQFLSVIQFISSMSVVLFMGVYLVFHSALNNVFGFTSIIMMIMFIQMFFSPAFELWSAKERYEYKYKRIVGYTIFYTIINTIVSIIAVSLSKEKGTARILSFMAVQTVFYAAIYIYNMIKGKKLWQSSYAKFALRFNIPLIPHGLANQVLSRSDIFMIHYFLDSASAGIYSLGYGIALMFTMLTSSINNALVPWLFQKIKKKEYENILKITKSIMIGLSATITIIILLVPEIIHLFATEEYYDAMYVIPPVMVGIFFTMIYTFFINIEIYFEKTKLIMVGSIIVAVCNLILNAVFIPKYGYIAAAYTTLLSYIIYSIMHYFCAKKWCGKYINLKETYDLLFLVKIAVWQIGLMFLCIFLYSYTALRYAILASVIGVSYLNRNNIKKWIQIILEDR